MFIRRRFKPISTCEKSKNELIAFTLHHHRGSKCKIKLKRSVHYMIEDRKHLYTAAVCSVTGTRYHNKVVEVNTVRCR